MNNTAPSQVQKRRLTGTVVSDAMNKTRVVAVDRAKKHARYHKYYTVTTRFVAHDEQNAYHRGDVVVIEETRPLSARKRWIIIERIGSAPVPVATEEIASDAHEQNATE
ncbi:MAG: 30S ribosomal protein S17 [Candidatus Paceibacterota bacterium]|jgi:small subunit ribosomal protein S17